MTMKHYPIPSLSILFLWMAMLLVGCGRPSVPDEAQVLDKKANIFPDYTDIVIPCNIAPLNFMVRDKGDAFAVRWDDGKGEQLTAVSGNDGILQYDMKEWKDYLEQVSEWELNRYLYRV